MIFSSPFSCNLRSLVCRGEASRRHRPSWFGSALHSALRSRVEMLHQWGIRSCFHSQLPSVSDGTFSGAKSLLAPILRRALAILQPAAHPRGWVRPYGGTKKGWNPITVVSLLLTLWFSWGRFLLCVFYPYFRDLSSLAECCKPLRSALQYCNAAI